MVILIIVIIVILVVSHNHHHNRNNRNNRSHNYNHHNYNHNNNIKMSSPWVENRMKKQEEKILKYGPLRWELKRQYPSFQVTQHNIIIDVLGGYSKDVSSTVKKLTKRS